MNKFWGVLKRFLPSYKKEAIGVFFFGGLSTVLSLFSFALFVPILEILFKTRNDVYQLVSLDVPASELFGALKNNLYYYVTEFIDFFQRFLLRIIAFCYWIIFRIYRFNFRHFFVAK